MVAPVVKNLPANAGDIGPIPESKRSPGERNGNPLQYFCLKTPVYRGTWWATVRGVTKSRRRPSELNNIKGAQQLLHNIALRTGIFPAISVNKDGTVTSDCSHQGQQVGEPRGNSARKEHLPSSSHQTAATPYGEPRGNSGCENSGCWPQTAEVPIKGMISGGPDSCIFPYIEKH